MYFYQYVITLLYRFEQIKKDKRAQGTRLSNKLKLLKAKDPELYIFKKFGSDAVYSRICQKNHQPLIYDEEEWANLEAKLKKKAIKFWNYTTNRPAYYLCDNPKIPLP